ncbi:MAG: AarF/UbiB family protein [Pseudomonadota bacterium]
MISFFNTIQPVSKGLPVTPDPKEVLQHLRAVAQTAGAEPFRKIAAEKLMALVNSADIIPEEYREYRTIVHDGLLFFLSHLSFERLIDIIADQMTMTDPCCNTQRLLALAKKCPTLHKLGQIIARNKHIDPDIRKWFVHLENGNYGTDADTIRPHIEKQVQPEKELFFIRLGAGILSEASVGTVFPFCWKDPETGKDQKGVFKILRPGVRTHLSEELRVIEDLAVFFQLHANRYSLKDFKFAELFRDIREALAEEIDLLGEQTHLWDAYQFYKDTDDVQIPELAPFCNQAVTAMAFLDGEKVTEAQLPGAERKTCAKLLFDSLILKPIFSRSESAIFHGDPHAGNILASYDEKSHRTRIALVDWSLAGHLSKPQRIGILQLVQSVIKGNIFLICKSIMALSSVEGTLPEAMPTGLADKVTEVTGSSEYATFNLVKKAFWLVDQAARCGAVFHRDLLLFRKSLFTLEGILNDLDPEYDIDDMMMKYLAKLIIGEIPRRFGCLLFPGFDTPGNFRSLMSNNDLRNLFLYQVIEALKTSLTFLNEMIRKHVPMTPKFNFSAFSIFPDFLDATPLPG